MKLKNIKLKNKSLIEWKIESFLTNPFESSIKLKKSKDFLKREDFSRRSFSFSRPLRGQLHSCLPETRTLKKTVITDWIKNIPHSTILNSFFSKRVRAGEENKNFAKEIWLKKNIYLKQNKKYRKNFENQLKKNLSLYFFISRFLFNTPESSPYFISSHSKYRRPKNPVRKGESKILQPQVSQYEDDKTAIRFILSGRLNGVRMKRKFSAYNGNISTQTFSINSNYIQKNIYTKWGVLGLRIWNRLNSNPYLSGNRRFLSLSSSLLNTQFSESTSFGGKEKFNFKKNFQRKHMEDLKKYNPTTPSLRHRLVLKSLPSQSSSVSRNKIRKIYKINKRILFKGYKKTSGRNNQGRITSFRKGGGHKKLYRYIDYLNNNSLFSKAIVLNIENNPYSNANIALLKINNSIISSKNFFKQSRVSLYKCENKSFFNNFNAGTLRSFFYIVAPQQLQIGDEIKGLYFNKIQKFFPHLLKDHKKNKETLGAGELYFLKDIPVGTYINNVEIQKGKGSQIARSAGTYCILLKTLNNNKSIIKLPSNKIIEVNSECTATIGQVSNSLYRSRILGKAGAARWLGIRPKTRGEAMNAVDHPHGGKNHGPGGLRNQPKNRWGKLAKWKRTRKN